MAGVTHAKVSAVLDDADASIIRPSDWNALHPSAPDTVTLTTDARTETNPNSGTMFARTHGIVYDTRNATAFRFGFNLLVPGSAAFALYTTYFGVDLVEHLLNGIGQTLAANTAGLKVSPWIALPSDAIAEHMRFQLRYQGGDSVADPSFGTFWFSFR